jgi:hypothetical protein
LIALAGMNMDTNRATFKKLGEHFHVGFGISADRPSFHNFFDWYCRFGPLLDGLRIANIANLVGVRR